MQWECFLTHQKPIHKRKTTKANNHIKKKKLPAPVNEEMQGDRDRFFFSSQGWQRFKEMIMDKPQEGKALGHSQVLLAGV